jgi:methane monooxygenase PmoA-like
MRCGGLIWPAALGLLATAAVGGTAGRAADLTAEKGEQGVTVKIDGQLFAEYVVKSGNRPILWPILGPTGKPMTRSFPMRDIPGESRDHLHQRSLWFAHGNVNGVSFWLEGSKAGSIRHREFVAVQGGKEARIVTRNDWLAPDEKKVCEDQRTLVFRIDGEQRVIDFEAVVRASEGPLTFGDTKEGTFAVRTADTMKVDAKLGGQIVNSEGRTDQAAWGQPAAWVDYFGPVDGEQVGIAILNHPSSFRYPTRWHVRTYGLFAANPFCLKDFEEKGATDGSYTLDRGQSLTFRYRLILHRGDYNAARIAEAFAEYGKERFGAQ